MGEYDKYEEALTAKNKILKKLKPLRRRENRAIRRLHRAEKKLKAIRVRIVDIEVGKDLAKLSKDISTYARKQRKLSEGNN